jgi:hypothetical protein
MMNLWEPDDNVVGGVFTTASHFDIAMRCDRGREAAVANFCFIITKNCCLTSVRSLAFDRGSKHHIAVMQRPER